MAKFTVDTDDLKKHVGFIKAGLGNSRTDLSVMLMKFNISPNQATIFAQNKEIMARSIMPIETEEDQALISFSLLGAKLDKLANHVGSEKVYFSVDDTTVEITSGFLKVSMEVYDGAMLKNIERAAFDDIDKEGEAFPREFLAEALTCAKSCSTSDSMKPEVNHVEFRAGRCLSSDGRKAMIYTHKDFNEEVELKVPTSCLNNVLNGVKGMSDVEHVQVLANSGYFLLKGGTRHVLAVRKIERVFPEIENQIANTSSPEEEVAIDRTVLESMIRGVSLGLSSEDVRITVTVKGDDKNSQLLITAVNSSQRTSTEYADCGREGSEEIDFPISFKHLLDTLGVFKGDSIVDLMIFSSRNILIVKDVTEAREVFHVLPFRTEAAIAQEEEERKEKEKAGTAAEVEEEEDGVDIDDVVDEEDDVDLD